MKSVRLLRAELACAVLLCIAVAPSETRADHGGDPPPAYQFDPYHGTEGRWQQSEPREFHFRWEKLPQEWSDESEPAANLRRVFERQPTDGDTPEPPFPLPAPGELSNPFRDDPDQNGPPQEGTLPGVEITPEGEEPGVFDLEPFEFDDFQPEPEPYYNSFDAGSLRNESVGRLGLSDFDDPRAITVIDQRELQERNPLNMQQALEWEVGVLVQQTGRGQVSPFVRGLTGQHVLIMIDGVRLNNSTFRLGPNQYFNTIDPGSIESIDVIRGPQSVAYGADAIGGVINVNTKSSYGDGFSGNFVDHFSTADLANYSRLNVSGLYDRWGVFTGASYLNANDLDRGGDLGRQGGTAYNQYAGDLKFEYAIDDNELLTALLQHFEQNDLFRSDRFPTRQTIFDPQQRDLAYVRYQAFDTCGPLFDTFTFTVSWQRQSESVIDTRDSTNFRDVNEVNTETTGATLWLERDLDRYGRLAYGAEWYHDHVDSGAFRYNKTTGAPIGPRTPTYPDNSYYERVGVFMEWEVDLTERLKSVAGLRYEHIALASTPEVTVAGGGSTPVFISPSFSDWIATAGFVYELDPDVNLVGNFSEGFRPPSIDDLAATNTNVQQNAVDNPSINLGPEHSYNFEVGVKADFDRLHLQTFYFWNNINDYIQRDNATAGGGGTILFERSNRNSIINGYELAAEYELDDRGWSLYGNFWYVFGKDLVEQVPLSRIPPTQGVIGLRWRDPSGPSYFDVFGWLVAKQDRLNPQDLTDSRIPDGGTPGYGTLNFRVGTKLTEYDRVAINVDNLLDKAYRVHGSGVDGAGATAILTWERIW